MLAGILIGIAITLWTVIGGIFGFLLILGADPNAGPLLILCGPVGWGLFIWCLGTQRGWFRPKKQKPEAS